MAVRITSAESIRRAILADALLREIFEKVEVNTSGLAPIALGPSIGILGIPVIEGFEAEWKLNIIGLTQSESNQVAEALERIFPGSSFGFSGDNVSVRIYSLVTKEVLESVEQQQKIKQDEERTKKLESAIDYASKLQSGADGQRGERGERGEQGLRGEPGLPGRDGRDGRDIDVTETELGELKDVYVPEPKIGHVLTWDGANWVALYVPQVYKYAGGGGGGGISDAPQDGNYYVRQDGQWVLLSDAMNALGMSGGDFDP
jgi:hypothetical protein